MSVRRSVNAEDTPYWPLWVAFPGLSADLTGRCRLLLRSCSGTRRILHLRPTGRRNDADAERDNYSDGDPERWYIEQIRRHGEPDDQDDEADDVCSERGHGGERGRQAWGQSPLREDGEWQMGNGWEAGKWTGEKHYPVPTSQLSLTSQFPLTSFPRLQGRGDPARLTAGSLGTNTAIPFRRPKIRASRHVGIHTSMMLPLMSRPVSSIRNRPMYRRPSYNST
jgi:hypothetical protein